jgi:hypothetical protein
VARAFGFRLSLLYEAGSTPGVRCSINSMVEGNSSRGGSVLGCRCWLPDEVGLLSSVECSCVSVVENRDDVLRLMCSSRVYDH